jgi:adenylate cyclase
MKFARWLKAVRKWFRNPAFACVFISLAVFGGVLWLQKSGNLQRADFTVRGIFTKAQLDYGSTDDHIVIVGMTEEDLQKYGFPISDEWLLSLLKKIDQQEPCTIGLDLYRDLPEPRIFGKPESEEFQKGKQRFDAFCAELKKLTRLVVITRVGFVPPPPAFADVPDQVSANNLPKDTKVDGVYRRAPLFVEVSPTEQKPSFSLMLAMAYLNQQGVDCGFVPNPAALPGDDSPLIRLGRTTIPRLTPDAGGYVHNSVQNYEYIADFRGPFKFRHMDLRNDDSLGQYGTNTPYDYSFGEILEGTIPKEALKGKIVLVATVMQSIKDSNPTPIHDNFRGVQYHAMLVHQLLEAALNGREPTRWWSERREAVWIACCTLLGGLMGLWLRSPVKLVPALGLLLAGIYFGAEWGYKSGIWILVAAPVIGCLLAAALVTSYVVALERADKRAVQSLFSKHVSKKVADAIMREADQFLEGGKMAPRSFNGTVIFTDLAGFSTASEKLTAVQTMRWLNEYMEVMASLVEEYEGTVNKYIGDAIMAVFGAPIIHQDDVGINADAVRAIRCALHMRRDVPILNARWKETSPDMPPVAMRVGIITGPLVDGSFGTAERMEWTVIGDTVNRANRLEAAGKEVKDQLTEEEKLCPILIGPDTFERVGDQFHTVPVPNMTLKGISERVTVYRVLSERAPSAPPPSTRSTMKKLSVLAALFVTHLAVAQDTPAPAATTGTGAPPATTTPPAKPPKLNLLSYKPPKTAGSEARKDGDGASRAQITLSDGSTITLPDLYVLTPKQGVALTTQAQPSLFTYQTAMCPVEYRVTISKPGQAETAFIYAVSRTAQGLHRVNLADFDATLEPNVEYQWTVLLRPEPGAGSKDLEAHGSIMRVKPDAALTEKLKTAAPYELPAVYAEAGMWYDTLGAISDQIAANPGDKDLLELRAGLLKQANLDAPASQKTTPLKITPPKDGKSKGPPVRVGSLGAGN